MVGVPDNEYQNLKDRLPERQGRFKDLASSFPAVIYVAKAYGDYGATFVGENVREQTGYDPEDFTKDSKFWTEHLHPDDQKVIFAKLPSLVEKGHWVMQYRFKHKDGSYRWMFEEARMVYDEKGKPKEIIGYWADITELKQAEQACKETENAMQKVNQCFMSFGPDPLKNLGLITKAAGQVLEATCVLYNRKEGEMLVTLASWQIPPDMKKVDRGRGHICFDVIEKGGEEPIVIRDLQHTKYAKTDPNVKKYNLQTYVSYPIKIKEETVASLCAVYQNDVVQSDLQLRILHMLGKAASIEEERKQVEKERRDSEERLKVLFEEAPDAIFLGDIEGEFVDCNKAAERLTGYTREEIIGKNISELRLLPPDQIPVAFKAKAEAIEHEITGLVEYTLNRKDRTQAIVEIKAHAVNLEDKTLMLGIVRDVTARRQTENELRIKDRTIESDLGGVAISDLKGNVAYTNKSFMDMWGYDNDLEVVGKPATEFWQDKRQASKVIEDLQRTGRWMGEMVAKRKDGSTFKAALSASIATDTKGEPISMTGSFVEIIERRPVSMEVPEMEQMLGETYPESVGAVLLISRDLKILWANKTALKQTGYKLEEVVGNYCYEILHACDGPCKFPKEVCPIREVIRTGVPITVFHTHFDRHGNEIYVEETVSPFKEGKAKVDKFVDKVRDITLVLKMSEL